MCVCLSKLHFFFLSNLEKKKGPEREREKKSFVNLFLLLFFFAGLSTTKKKEKEGKIKKKKERTSSKEFASGANEERQVGGALNFNHPPWLKIMSFQIKRNSVKFYKKKNLARKRRSRGAPGKLGTTR